MHEERERLICSGLGWSGELLSLNHTVPALSSAPSMWVLTDIVLFRCRDYFSSQSIPVLLALVTFSPDFGNQGQSWEPARLPGYGQHSSHGKNLCHHRAIHWLQVWHPNPENRHQLQGLHVSDWLCRSEMGGEKLLCMWPSWCLLWTGVGRWLNFLEV